MVDRVRDAPDEVQILSWDPTATPSVVSQLEPGLEIILGVSEVTGVLRGQSSFCLNNNSKAGVPRAFNMSHARRILCHRDLQSFWGLLGCRKGFTRHTHEVT